MIHDEKTIELELPGKKASNIVRVDFSNEARKTQNTKPVNPNPSAAPSVPLPIPTVNRRLSWFRELDLGSPWIIRLAAVLAILLLCLLVI